MADKFASAAALTEEVQELPTIHKSETQIIEEHEQKVREPKTDEPTEREEGYLLLLRESLKQELKIEAVKNSMTIKQFIMSALKEKGLDVTDADMEDKRRKK